MTAEEKKNPTKSVGRIWLYIGLVMLISPFAIISDYLGGDQNVFLLMIAIGTIFLCGWIMFIGVQLIIKYDLRQ